MKIRKDLKNKNFYVLIEVNNNIIENISVYDINNDEEYLPFKIKNYEGNLVNQIRKEVNEIVLEYKNDKKNKIYNFIENRYSIKGENIFKKHPEIIVFRNKKKKWFGIITKNSILNLKNKPEKIEKILDNNLFLPAYHMNKKHWFSINLDKVINFEEIFKLIEESFNLV